jgi:general secretion pathway protein D
MKKRALAIIIMLSFWGCVTFSPSYKLGTQAEMNKKWEEAIAYYEKASLDNPKEPVYRLALQRAKIGASLSHLQEARRLAALGKKEEAKAEYVKALSYNPRDTMIALEAKAVTAEAPKEPELRKEKIEFPIKLKAREENLQLKFPVETSLRSIFLALGRTSGINIIFDENFRDVPFSTDLTNTNFEQALKSLCLTSKNFYRIIDEKTVVIVPDQPLKRMQYEVNCIKTFYLSNISAQELLGSLSQMLRTQMKAPSIIFDKNLNSITIRDTPQAVELADKLIRIWDKPKGEVMIDLEIMEVSRIKLRQLGLSFDQNIMGLRYGGTTSGTETSTSWYNLKNLGLSKAENYSISLPVAFVQFLESDADTKIIAQPRLRGLADEEINHKVGQKIPIPRTTFSPFAAGGVSQQPITNFEQQDVGIEIKITPKVHQEKDITLALEIKVTSLGGTGYADIPIINNREIKNTIRLKDGETNLIAGLLRDEERRSLKGIPGLKDIPLLGRIFSAEDTTLEQTDVIMMITPYIIRSIPLNPDDSKPVWVDVESVTSERGGQGIFEEEVLNRELDAEEAQRELRRRRQQETALNQVFLSPGSFDVPVNREFRIAVNVRSDQDLGSLSLVLNYNPKQMTLKDVSEGGLVRQLGDKVPFLKNIDNNGGVCTIGFSSPQIGRGAKGGGTLATLLFESKGSGESVLNVTSCSATGALGQAVSFQTSGSRIVIR